MPNDNTSEPGNAQVTHIHIERGAVAMGTDGPLGTVEQIVMDENTGELRALVVRRDASGANANEVEIAAAHVVPGTAVGHQVNLDIGSADIRAHPELAQRYEPERYAPVREEVVLPPSVAGGAAIYSERPVVTGIRGDAADVVVAGPSSANPEMAAPIVSERTDTATQMRAELTPDETPTLVLRAQRSLTDRERELDEPAPAEPAPAVVVEPPITPDLVAATAAEVTHIDNSAADELTDAPSTEVPNAAPNPATSDSSPDAGTLDESEQVAAPPASDATETQASALWPTSELPVEEAPDDSHVIADEVEGPYLRTLRPMGDSVWVAVPASAAEEQWLPEWSWRNYDIGRFRRPSNLGIMLAAGLGLAAAAGAIVLVRRAGARRASTVQRTTAIAGRSARSFARTAQKRASAAKVAMPAALESAADTARRVRRTANDLPGRWRWFRRGVRVGAAVATPLAQVSRRRQPRENANRLPAEAVQ